jgi:biopolymer transport protein ExbB/TolQ
MFKNRKKLVLVSLLASLNFLFAEGRVELDYGYIFKEGQVFSWMLTFLAVAMIVLSIVKSYKLIIKEKIDAQKFYLKLKGFIKNEQYDEAVKVSANFKNTTLGFIFWNGIIGFVDAKNTGAKSQFLKNSLQNAFDEAGLQKIPEIESGLYWFDIIAQVATLLGLLGTIYGLMIAFQSLNDPNLGEADKTKELTNGIFKAMGTTGMGLIVAIPTMFVKGWLQGKAESIINDIDEFSVKTINQISNTIKD